MCVCAGNAILFICRLSLLSIFQTGLLLLDLLDRVRRVVGPVCRADTATVYQTEWMCAVTQRTCILSGQSSLSGSGRTASGSSLIVEASAPLISHRKHHSGQSSTSQPHLQSFAPNTTCRPDSLENTDLSASMQKYPLLCLHSITDY